MKLNKKIDLTDFEYMSYEHCTFCQSSDVTKIVTIHTHPEVSYFFCNHCKVSYTNKQLSVSSTQNFYSNYFDNHLVKTGIEPSILGNHLFKLLTAQHFVSPTIRLLDYGGGDGSIAKYLAQQLVLKNKCQECIIDVFDVYESKNKLDGINYLKLEKEITVNTYDIIIASAVLEHLNAPLATLNVLFDALRTNGYLYSRTPYRLPLKKLLEKLQLKKVGMQFPWHLFDMGNTFWNNFPILFSKQFGIKLKLIKSQPSLTETSFKLKKKKYMASILFKLPAYIFKNWNYVGGWEVFIQKL